MDDVFPLFEHVYHNLLEYTCELKQLVLRVVLTIFDWIFILILKMPNICCAARCFNKSSDGYALIRFPKENQYKKAWVDAVFGETSRSLNNLRLCEVSIHRKNVMQDPNKNSLKSASPFNAFLISGLL
ncbi:PREDICTED: uncharacterized protein LOC108766839 [Trachymyrmex cornetzi]|uniref:uncharacterized protein LOC108766839 n=1 Tax=Trachymyrmex cornetzi TaxID=471704 RepID=UPI00084F2BC0|nr:PREDICTED: uncharacterized protein LOC108766839 [Trachymyrmex cornetzi]